MDLVTGGRASSYWDAIRAPAGPWDRATGKMPRLFPKRGGGRRLRHPYLSHIVYPRLPDRTLNFGFDRLRHVRPVIVKTLDSSAVAKFPDAAEDVVIREVWFAQDASTETRFFHQLHTYLRTVLPIGRYVGWQPRDLSPKNFFVELLDVQLGPTDDYEVEELGKRPHLSRSQLTLSFKLIRDVLAPAGVLVGVGL